ncbi:hypothetical protein A3C23_01590 [Candidatus Roizmanbacteria bacterium RIFCSPHIGHO2_02_FULL_37_13b]|uniref:Polyprenyl synthetase n=1 Tax=Candidatus Roizmanbacteria bacterium RIFCSPLOWO2_02_FULL_36_11 TaxID=1802071 RepID=A0A1F7JIJ3_9BACT|nr:MAG: hypothetical protein A3C23_01590 [Candidatus Roizmanbacteria bacterium RIFCSPHIGHO2_02_FULL_37_13b]OGK55430.1 MAG: hypothetical protein A3H78_06060 [Candidatus Roizmanbacteria bacterium RIFCSPLOWO2_02_FULL_36_11]
MTDAVNKYFMKKKEEINDYVERIFLNKRQDYIHFGSFGNNAIERLKEMTLGGKGVRGGLLIFTADAYKAKNQELVMEISATIELIHSSLLIHDDIADNDMTRRGKPTIYAQYLPFAKSKEIDDPINFGKSIATVIGDIGFFIAGRHLIDSTKNLENNYQILSYIFREIIYVCFAQLDDITFGFSSGSPGITNIKRVYQYKTARYSFSMPFTLGAMLARVNENTIHILQSIGNDLGFIYQLRDDDMGLFSEEATIGKPVGSDIRENKKTLIRELLYKKAAPSEKEFLNNTFGNKELSNQNIEKVKKMVIDLGVKKEIENLIISYQKQAAKKIGKLNLAKKDQEFLYELINYVEVRKN